MATAVATKPEQANLADVVPIGAIKTRYRWQSKMGSRRGHSCLIDIYQDWWSDPPQDRKIEGEVMGAAWKRRYTDEEKKTINQAYLENGSDLIKFTYERGPENAQGQSTVGYCWYATNSDAIAWVVRRHIAENDAGAFEELTNVNVKSYKVGNKVFADTPAGKDLAFAEVDATGLPLETVAPVAATG